MKPWINFCATPIKRLPMEDKFFEEDKSIFGDDDVFDCIILEEIGKNSKHRKGSGCLTSIVFIPILLVVVVFVLVVTT